jgi:signal transduction histidine kinase
MDGSLWFGGERNRVDRLKSGVWSHYPVEERGQKRLRPISVNCFFEDVRGQLWAGTSVGLARLEGSSFSVIAAPSPSPEVFGIAETGRGPLIVGGTSGAFLFQNSGLSVLPRPDGYLDHTIFEVLKDETGDFWLSSNRGVLRVRQYDLESFLEGTRPEVIVEYFDIADGLLTLQCNGSTSPAAVRSRDGRLWFATNRGVSVVDPAKLHLNRLPPPVHIGRFLLDGEAVARPQEAVFPAGSRNAEIHYDALSFIAPQRVKFRYRLDGLDDTWVDAGNRRVAYYNVLPPGRYTFRVIAANHDGVWNDIGDSLWFTVEPYFYQTDWFLVLVIAAIASATYSYFRYRVHRLRREAAVLEATVAERTQALREANQQMQRANAELHAANEALTDLNLEKSEFLGIAAHDLKSPLTVIRGYAEVLKSSGAPQEKREEILDRIVQAARRMTALIQNLLDVHALESGKVEFNIEPCPAFELVESVRISFEERALAKDQTLAIEADEGARILADKTLLSQIVENLVSNAIKYSPPGGAIRIGVRNLENAVAIEVQDQGPGLTKEDQQKLFGKFARLSARPTAGENSTGLGLSIVKRLTEAMDGRVWCESEPGKGSTFIVELPRASG